MFNKWFKTVAISRQNDNRVSFSYVYRNYCSFCEENKLVAVRKSIFKKHLLGTKKVAIRPSGNSLMVYNLYLDQPIITEEKLIEDFTALVRHYFPKAQVKVKIK